MNNDNNNDQQQPNDRNINITENNDGDTSNRSNLKRSPIKKGNTVKFKDNIMDDSITPTAKLSSNSLNNPPLKSSPSLRLSSNRFNQDTTADRSGDKKSTYKTKLSSKFQSELDSPNDVASKNTLPLTKKGSNMTFKPTETIEEEEPDAEERPKSNRFNSLLEKIKSSKRINNTNNSNNDDEGIIINSDPPEDTYGDFLNTEDNDGQINIPGEVT
jgi:hypothetical protein